MRPRTGTEQEVLTQGRADRQNVSLSCHQQPLPWPTIANTPINEFSTEGYMTCAFLVLFPTRAADFSAPRPRTVTIGYYFKHLLMYRDGRFARHPRFTYFALNTEMRHRALGARQIYVKQNTTDAQLTVQELRDMVSVGGEAFSRRVLHYATSLRGTRSYWFKQRSRLISMIDTLRLPTVFLTHSAADLQWPELAQLTCPDDPTNSTRRSQALRDNPAVADWFFYHRIQLFLRHFYVDVLGVTDYWFRFEWQHRGSPHVHGLAWLPDAPDVQRMLAPGAAVADRQQVTRFIDSIVSTTNPGILPDGSNAADALPPQTNPHVCNKRFVDVIDYEEDLRKLIATCQRHTTCSPAYCLRTKHGKQSCRFNYPKALQTHTDVDDQ